MIAVCRRRRHLHDGALLLPFLALFMCATAAAAQVPPPVPPVRDTLRVDTLAVDTIDVDRRVEGDTLPPPRPVVRYPAMPLAPAAGFAAGDWVWDRAALLRETPTSLVDLLDRIPSVATFRGGTFAQPEAASAFGGTVGRVEIEIDGYVLDPIAAASFDLAQIPLGQIREIRVQRRLGLLRIRILTDQPTEPEPYTRVEAGIGQPPANLFRGVVLAPYVLFGPLGIAVERLDTEGPARDSPASVFSGWAKWAWTDGDRGVQFEMLQATVQRRPESPWPLHRTRRDLIVRGRNSFAPGLMAEVYAGRATVADSVRLPPEDTVSDRIRRMSSTQAGARVAYQHELATVQGRLRYRDAEFLPRIETGFEVEGGLGPIRAGGEVAHATWDAADATTWFSVHGEVGLPLNASVFAELTGGRRGAPPYSLEGDEVQPTLTDRSGWRTGVSASVLGGRATGSLALFSLNQDQGYPFGLPFDTAGIPITAGDTRGLEAHGRLIVVPGWLALESWITEWLDGTHYPYFPVRSWRTALESHVLPLPSGNLEIIGRLEAAQRSGVLLYSPVTPVEPDGSIFAEVPPSTRLNGYLQIRIIDVRIFLRYEDLLGQNVEDLPGRPMRGPRIFYGVKWNLWN